MKKIIFLLLLFQSIIFAESKFGISIKGGWFGIPQQFINAIGVDIITIDSIPYAVVRRPSIEGEVYGIELRYYGKKGPRGGYSTSLSYEKNSLKGEGMWEREIGHGSFGGTLSSNFYTLTFTAYFDIFASFPVHPYFGLGIGASYLSYTVELIQKEGEEEIRKMGKDNLIIPVFHLPFGIKVNIGEFGDLKLETGFKNGFYLLGGICFIF